MIGDKLFNDDLLHELKSDFPDIISIRKLVIKAYNAENSTKINHKNAITSEEEEEIVKWLNQISWGNPRSQFLLFHEKIPVLLPFISSTLSAKIGSLSQFHCPICSRRTNSIYRIINIRISAVSKQSVASNPIKRKAFEKAIKYRLNSLQTQYVFHRGEKLCVHIVFVLGKQNRDKDLDNMAKALLDALKGILFGDDMDIDHLSLMKIKTAEDDEFVTVNIRGSALNQQNDVIFNSMHHVWGESSLLDIKDFM
jgi:Holliday junction resolvase RusA-like endonuclease